MYTKIFLTLTPVIVVATIIIVYVIPFFEEMKVLLNVL